MHHVGPISGIATYKQELVATAGYDNQVILWNAQTGKALARGLHDHLANQCSFSPDGSLLASASSDYSARLWSIPDLRLRAILKGHQDDVEMVSFAPVGNLIATCSRDHTICLHDRNGSLLRSLTGHTADVLSITWMPDAKELVSSSDDGTIRRWSATTGEALGIIDMDGVETDTVIVTSDGAIVSGDDEGRITCVLSGKKTSYDAHNAGIKRLIYSHNLALLASLSYDRTLRIWKVGDYATLTSVKQAFFPAIVWPRSGAFLSADELVFGTFGSTYATYTIGADRWHVNGIVADQSLNAISILIDGREARIGDSGLCTLSDGASTQLTSLCNFLKPFGPLLLTGGQTGQVFDALSGRILHQHRSPVNCATVFRQNDTDYAVIGAYTGEGIVLQLTPDGNAEHITNIALHANAIKGIACDGESIFSVAADGAAAWHRTSDFSVISSLKHAHAKIANGCTMVSKGVYASVSRDLMLRIWSGNTARSVATPHRNSIKCIAASSDGHYLATGDYFGSVGIYDMLRHEWTLKERVSASGISSLCAFPDKHMFACTSYDGEIHYLSCTN